MTTAQTMDADKLSAALLDTEHKGIWQFYAFSKKAGENAISPYEVKVGPFMTGFSFPMVQYMGDKTTIIWPRDYAEGAFTAPAQ